MDCPICLDQIAPTGTLGRVRGCLHAYHDQCLTQWAAHSNLCPTCRQPFHTIDFVARNDPTRVLRTLSVPDRLMPNAAIDTIPREYVISPQQHAERQQEDDSAPPSGVCTICSSAQVRRRRMAACVACGAAFHTSCLGHAGEQLWFCPVCDCHQEFEARVPRQARVAVRGTQRMRGELEERLRPEPSDLAFDDYVAAPRPALNGGTRLRREARELESLSPAEANAWGMFHRARAAGTTSPQADVPRPQVEPEGRPQVERVERVEAFRTQGEDPALTQTTSSSGLTIMGTLDRGPSSGPGGRKRRKKPPAAAPCAAAPSSSPSRIGRLIGQIRQPRVTSRASPLDYSNDTSRASPLDANDTSRTSPLDNANDIPSDDPAQRQCVLTFNQKQQVQRHVRQQLRPWYGELGAIKSETEYIRVNKAISRNVYAAILADCAEQDKVDDYFADPARLERVVADCSSRALPLP